MALFQQNMSRDDTGAGSISCHGAFDEFSSCHSFGSHRNRALKSGCFGNASLSVNISQGKCCLFKLQLVFLS